MDPFDENNNTCMDCFQPIRQCSCEPESDSDIFEDDSIDDLRDLDDFDSD